MSMEIKFKVFYNNKVIGIERLSKKGWEWMSYDLNTDQGERWNKGVFPSAEYQRAQFTGLHDKNGREIYEGDLVKHIIWEYPFTIIFDNEMARFTCEMKTGLTRYIDGERLEVIGNIYENTELMEGGQG